jgi:hypothetical protein
VYGQCIFISITQWQILCTIIINQTYISMMEFSMLFHFHNYRASINSNLDHIYSSIHE